MIARLRGTVVEIGEDSVVVDVQGVGYLVHASPRLLQTLPATGAAADLVIETLVREDAITLVGFATAEEKRLFRLLQGIQGVGARLALAVLGVLEPAAFARAVASGDRAALTRAPGVGPRLAQRIVGELKDRLGEVRGSEVARKDVAGSDAGPLGDTVTALAQLGYGRSEAHGAAIEAVAELGAEAPLASLLRRALQILGSERG